MGETILLRNEIPLQVTGVLQPRPTNEHLNFEMLISFSTYEVPDGYLSDLTSWSWAGFHTYVLTEDGADVRQLESEINRQYEAREIDYVATLQPVHDIYFGSNSLTDAENSPIRSGNRYTTYWLMVVCLLIIAIASFNLMSSTFGLSIKRLREAGVRKVLGEERGSLISAMLLDSTLVSVLSFGLGTVVLVSVFPWVTSRLDWDIVIQLFESVGSGRAYACRFDSGRRDFRAVSGNRSGTAQHHAGPQRSIENRRGAVRPVGVDHGSVRSFCWTNSRHGSHHPADRLHDNEVLGL